MGKINLRWGDEKGLLACPFVLSDGREIELYLPADGLTADDADRLKRYIDTMVLEQQPKVSPNRQGWRGRLANVERLLTEGTEVAGERDGTYDSDKVREALAEVRAMIDEQPQEEEVTDG
jgi:hypothetical protein